MIETNLVGWHSRIIGTPCQDLSVDSLSVLKFKFILIYNLIYFDF
jgi:hypothetical protein